MWAVLLLAGLCCACVVSEAVIDCGESGLYAVEDLEAAAEIILTEFADFDGCVLHTLEYAGDDVSARELEYYRARAGSMPSARYSPRRSTPR